MKYLLPLLFLCCQKPKTVTKSFNIVEVEIPTNDFNEIDLRRSSTIPNDFNNPGCIRPGNDKIDAIAIGYCMTKNGKFLVFNTPQDGFMALILWKEQRPEWSLKKAISVYAPSFENNTSKYIKDACMGLDCTTSTKLKDVNTMKFISVIARIEGFTKW